MAVPARMTQHGDGEGSVEQMQPPANARSIDDFKDAYRSLEDADHVRLLSAVTPLAPLARLDPEDLIQEAVARVLEGRRYWLGDMELGAFLYQVARSVANGELRKRQRSPFRAAVSAFGQDGELEHDPEDREASPEESVIEHQECEMIESDMQSLFADDTAAWTIFAGRMDGVEGEALREMTGLTKTAYQSKCRLVQRRLNGYRRERTERL